MFNRQLKKNIKALDVEIGKLSEEINNLQVDVSYDRNIKVLTDLTELRAKLVKDQSEGELSNAVKELDDKIESLTTEIVGYEINDVYLTKLKKLEELTRVRAGLSECKVKESNSRVVIPVLVSGAVSISAILLILKYEEENVITSKSLNIAMKLFR